MFEGIRRLNHCCTAGGPTLNLGLLESCGSDGASVERKLERTLS
jgi:hypothetical protein